MKRLVNRGSFFALLSLTMLLSAEESAQEPNKRSLSVQGPMVLLAAFDKFEVVGMAQRMAIKTSTISFSTSSAIPPFRARSTWLPWNA
ncbi:MAG TPA: hypothetical protein VK813_02080, partial [Edaphobacter sp.]|nr:hypothetical protein [Edaphobacter sp.]